MNSTVNILMSNLPFDILIFKPNIEFLLEMQINISKNYDHLIGRKSNLFNAEVVGMKNYNQGVAV